MLTLPLKGVRTQTCPFCGTVHLCKTVHLVVDSEGSSIISHTTWNLIQANAPEGGGFTTTNPVAEPPAQNFAPETVSLRVKAFDLADGINPLHTVDTEAVVKHLLEAVPEATEEQVVKFLLAKVMEQGPAVSDK